MTKVLVASAKGPTALSVIRALGSNGIAVTVISESGNDMNLYSRYCAHKILYKPQYRSYEEYREVIVSKFLELLKNNNYDVFLPVLSEDILFSISQRKEEFEKYALLPISEAGAFKKCYDKSETMKMAIESGIPHPETYFVEDIQHVRNIKEDISYPVVIKPHMGEGARGVMTVFSPFDLERQYEHITQNYGPCYIQEFVHGEKYGAVFLMNRDSEPRRFLAQKCIREFPVTGGPVCFIETIENDILYEYGYRILKDMGYYGLAHMDFILDEKDRRFKIIEINPRFYGSIQLSSAAGVNIPFALVKMAIEGDIEKDLKYCTGIKCRNVLFADLLHLLSILKGKKSPKYKIGKLQTLINFLKFHQDDAYFVFSLKDPLPLFIHILNFMKSLISQKLIRK